MPKCSWSEGSICTDTGYVIAFPGMQIDNLESASAALSADISGQDGRLGFADLGPLAISSKECFVSEWFLRDRLVKAMVGLTPAGKEAVGLSSRRSVSPEQEVAFLRAWILSELDPGDEQQSPRGRGRSWIGSLMDKISPRKQRDKVEFSWGHIDAFYDQRSGQSYISFVYSGWAEWPQAVKASRNADAARFTASQNELRPRFTHPMKCNCSNELYFKGTEAKQYTSSFLREESVDLDRWETIYLCKSCGTKWLEDVLYPELQGGGIRRIRKLPLPDEDYRECQCDQLNELVDYEADQYLKCHLKLVYVDRPRWIGDHICPVTNTRWTEDIVTEPETGKLITRIRVTFRPQRTWRR